MAAQYGAGGLRGAVVHVWREEGIRGGSRSPLALGAPPALTRPSYHTPRLLPRVCAEGRALRPRLRNYFRRLREGIGLVETGPGASVVLAFA